ncbi:MAG TPA: exodeoxyribonuclease I [Candidatus Saccharimonadales bacterium]|nr:exodeoxyribonuclease I [Candidatus Saccharimonadales bacterium]
MTASFFFYDLETSGFNPHNARIMQFAGIRTDLTLKPVGDPVNVMIQMTEDTLPDPDAVLVTGITPQATIADGVTEAEFLRIFTDEVAIPGTIFVGYNTVRFDDEFMRCLHYRNFYDPYEWQWQDSRSRWDLLDAVRMTRALRPEGIEWPFDVKGRPTNRLELLTALNKLDHEHAHDALSDVEATIAVARLIRNKHEKLFEFLLEMRDKRRVAELVNGGQPFVYTSGKYPSEYEKTTVAYRICDHPDRAGGAFVYDLRMDPLAYRDSTPEQLAELWRWKKDAEEPRLPVKALQYNRCPAVAPLGVLDEASQQRLQLDMAQVKKHLASLKQMRDLEERLCKAWGILAGERPGQGSLLSTDQDVDASMYGGFFGNQDKQSMRVVRAASPQELGELGLKFQDTRLEALLPLYKARNYPKHLTSEEREQWERFCEQRLLGGGKQSRMAKYLTRLGELAGTGHLTDHQRYLLEELQLYAESIMPASGDV